MKKRLLFLLFVVICVSLTCLSASAEESFSEGYYTYTVTDGAATIKSVSAEISGDITIPETLGGYPVIAIGKEALAGAINIKSVVISDSVKIIDDYAFAGCIGLESVDIGNGVERIGVSAFRECHVLKNLKLSNNVTTIDSYAFLNCQKLEAITIPNSVKLIGNGVFGYCSSLKNIAIPDNVESIGSEIFFECTSLEIVTLSENIPTIPCGAFYDCSALKELTMPVSAKIFKLDLNSLDGKHTFYNCTNIEKITLTKGTTGAMQDYSSLSKTETNYDETPWYVSGCKEVIIEEGITYIGENAFLNCMDLEKVTIPDSVEVISDCAFGNCINIKSVSLPKVKSIDSDAFASCLTLENVTLGDSLETIGSYAFALCLSIKDITIPKNVNYIGNGAFIYDFNLENIYFSCNDVVMDEYTYIGYYPGLNYEQWLANREEFVPLMIESFKTGEDSERLNELFSLFFGDESIATTYGVIHAEEGSTAAAYAEKYGIKLHDYSSVVTAPTCYDNGYTTYTCSCGKTYVDNYINTNGHVYINHAEKDATCTANGYEAYQTCENCDYSTYKEIAATGHNYGNDNVCDNCGDVIEEEKEESFLDKIKAFFQKIADFFKRLFGG